MICDATQIDIFFLNKVKNIIDMEEELAAHPGDEQVLRQAKRMGFADTVIARLWGQTEEEVFAMRDRLGLFPVYKMIDTCASEFASYVPYFYCDL